MIQNRAVIWGTRSAPGVVAHARTSVTVIPATAPRYVARTGAIVIDGLADGPMFPLCLGFTWTVVRCSATDRLALCTRPRCEARPHDPRSTGRCSVGGRPARDRRPRGCPRRAGGTGVAPRHEP